MTGLCPHGYATERDCWTCDAKVWPDERLLLPDGTIITGEYRQVPGYFRADDGRTFIVHDERADGVNLLRPELYPS